MKLNISKIAVFGPHDRMNYGDFLFPIMLDFAFSKALNKKIEFQKYSIFKADYSKVGAFKSSNFRKLKKASDRKEIEVIIVAGGESMGATWPKLLGFKNKYFWQESESKIGKFLIKLIRIFNKDAYEYPFAIYKPFFNNPKVIYNSVGGIKGMKSSVISSRLADCEYVGVRETLSFEVLKSKKIVNRYLVPDSAIILSDVYRKDEVKFHNYIYFQLTEYKSQNQYKEVVAQLRKILETTNFNLLLGPIGIAYGHEDDKILTNIFKELQDFGKRVYFNNDYHIQTIMNFIANSECYIGTSLHGIITAMSFGVPYIGLNPNQLKIKYYLDSWSINLLNTPKNCNEFILAFNTLLPQFKEIREEIQANTQVQKKIYYKSIEEMITVIDS